MEQYTPEQISRIAAGIRSKIGHFPYREATYEHKLELMNSLKNGDAYELELDNLRELVGHYNIFKNEIFTILHKANWETSILASYYTDNAIVEAKFEKPKYGSISPKQAWEDDRVLVEVALMMKTKNLTLTSNNIREGMFFYNEGRSDGQIREISTMRPSWMMGCVEIILGDVKGKKWLDISAGWGDRLIAAIALGMEYTGYDPNTLLIEGHNNILKELSTDGVPRNIVYEPFETSTPKENYYDIVLTSPPYFTLELYSDQLTQSSARYPEAGQWVSNFLLKSLEVSLRSLKSGGYIAINIVNVGKIDIVPIMMVYMKDKSKFLGMFNLMNRGGYSVYQPVWVWQKP